MKTKLITALLFTLAILLSICTGCKSHSSAPDEPTDSLTTGGGPYARKPNIYIYPLTEMVVSVRLGFPLGGTVIQSSPTYSGEWKVEVKPTGTINNTFGCLFYECQTPDAYQHNSGWLISRDSLSTFFKTNLSESGFNEREISDFTEYWIPRLTEYSHFTIYPQYSSDIEKMITLTISPLPDNVLRLFYVIKGSTESDAAISKPIIPKFNRSGFVVAEWGVVLE